MAKRNTQNLRCNAQIRISPVRLVDQNYVLFAAGLLADVEPDAAFDFARGSLEPVSEKPAREEENELRVTSG